MCGKALVCYFGSKLIDKIEIIKGPGTLLYGNNGFAGVVNSFGTEHNLENILDIKNFKPKINLSLFYLKQVLSNNKYWNKMMHNNDRKQHHCKQ